jgi:hypothetical protein
MNPHFPDFDPNSFSTIVSIAMRVKYDSRDKDWIILEVISFGGDKTSDNSAELIKFLHFVYFFV